MCPVSHNTLTMNHLQINHNIYTVREYRNTHHTKWTTLLRSDRFQSHSLPLYLCPLHGSQTNCNLLIADVNIPILYCLLQNWQIAHSCLQHQLHKDGNIFHSFRLNAFAIHWMRRFQLIITWIWCIFASLPSSFTIRIIPREKKYSVFRTL